ncbi:MAG: hypothetical protein GTO24_22840 [candidate division Zixibacteria bacterium]|nr:hypothetical protein [candidate division Zixibacteria bacterium]
MQTSLLRWYCERTSETLRYEGPHYLFLRVLPLCLSPLGSLGLLNFFQKDLTEPLREVRAIVELTVGQATESDIDQLTRLVKKRYAHSKNLEWYSKLGIRNTILQRFKRGCKCFVGKVGKEIVHYNWIFFHWEETDPGMGCFIHLRDDEALCNDGFTAEGWRGKSVHTAVNNQMLRFLQQTGYRRAYTVAGTQNKSSQKALYRVGWAHSGTMLYFIPRGTKKTWIWRIKGSLGPFAEKQIPAYETRQGNLR